jgi:hypothetical protein
MKRHEENPKRYELVASVTRYTGREDMVTWLKRFPTRYKSIRLKEILDKTKDAKLVLWCLEDVWNSKLRECYVEDGITIL